MSEEKLHHHVVPPGFRFHPTDEELINYYLKKKVASGKFDLDHVIREVDLNKLEPWDLREKCKVDASHQTEWYFFSHKDKKYPTGTRTNRATKAGFWKATGRDKAVFSSLSHGQAGQRIGMRKTLVFYKGRAPHGLKTDWIMHEYRLQDTDLNNHHHASSNKHTNEDGWVVCRVFKKRNYEEKSSCTSASSFDQSNSNLSDEEQLPAGEGSKPAPKAEKSRKQQQAGTISNAPIISTNNIALISCKQELVEDPAPQSATTTTFLQLPQLESPKMGPNPSIINTPADNPNANASDLNRAPPTEGGQKPQQILQCANNLEMQEAINGKAFFMTEEDLAHYIIDNSNGQMADYNYQWSLSDNLLARYHGIDSIANFAGDQFFPQFNAHLTRIQQPVDNSPSTCEIELWNFPR